MKLNLLNNTIKLGAIHLRVVDLDKMIDYYTEVMGLDLYSNDGETAQLGIDKNVYLHLEYREGNRANSNNHTGLYHMAFVLPSENDLVAFINHLIEIDHVPTGVADHIFSEAIYFNDLEGNGIEVYVDRDKSEWKKQSNGQLALASDPLDFEALQKNFDNRVWNKMPKGAKLGHNHYSLWKLPEAKDFVSDVLGMDMMIEIPSAIFISKDGYHHHFGMNIWSKIKDGNLPDDMAGLVSSEIVVDNLDEIKEKVKGYDGPYDIQEHYVEISDKQGLTFILISEDAYHSKNI